MHAARFVKTIDGRRLLGERMIAAAVVSLPAAGTLLAIRDAWFHGVAARDVALAVGLYAATMLGITLGFHRLFSHRSFETSKAMRAALGILGSMALQGPILRWSAEHRRHHAATDAELDPHSPRRGGGFRGLFHAHIGWFFDATRARATALAPDLVGDPMVRRLDALYPAWAIASLGLPAAMGWLIGGTWTTACSALLWGGFVRIFVNHHVTWCVNSVAHRWGRQPFATGDDSRNVSWLAWLTFGEGWHNGHHAFPSSARQGLLEGETDACFALLRWMEATGIAWNVRRVDPDRVACKLRESRRRDEISPVGATEEVDS